MARQRKPNQIREPVLQEIFEQAFGSRAESATLVSAQKWSSLQGGHLTTQPHTSAETASFLMGWKQRAK